MIKDQIITEGKLRWKIRQARSMADALDAIGEAAATGSVGMTIVEDNTRVGGTEEMVADVVRVNSDDTEVKPYSTSY